LQVPEGKHQKDKNAFFAAAGDAKVSVVDVRDITQAAVVALTWPGHEEKTYYLTGPSRSLMAR
jgi:uncharacterized protein YbjT (DUF2867 family)